MNNFERMISCIKTNKIYIQMHNFPDPDAVASAYGLKKLLETRNISSVICYRGRIDTTITAKMAEYLHIEMIEQDDILQMNENSEIILVDSQKGNANIVDMIGNEIACIDHHPTFEKAEYLFSDIRPDVGACASIITQYFYENNIDIDQKLATVLLYGIKIDTANLTRGVSELDLDMFHRIYELADHKLIKHLDTSVLKINDLKSYARAISTIETKGSLCFAFTEDNCPEALTAGIADFMLALEGIDMVVVYSQKKDGIKISVRSNGIEYNAGLITNDALCGIGNGGGHEHMAGGFVPFDKYKNYMENNSNKEECSREKFEMIQKKFISSAEKLKNK